ncbi:MAG: biopolymer transporter ExbD [Myxococcales bacterium]|nr:biopolymer transporter ExbD [Myxococcales bacterium]MCB9708777.1 biopolymer transporter ExbD [Myxococcales bacterium]
MGMSQPAGDDDLITGINVTPLVDIVLVLLIILMVTASYIVSQTIPMELPTAKTGEAVASNQLSLSIDQQGKFYLNATPVSDEELRARARELVNSKQDARAIIAASGKTTHARVVQAIDILRQEKVTKFAINVRPEDLAK